MDSFQVGKQYYFPGKPFKLPERLIVANKTDDQATVLKGHLSEETILLQGMARIEKVSEWYEGGWVRGELLVPRYSVRGRWYEVPAGSSIKVLVLEKPNIMVIRTLTRDSQGREKKVCPRFPVVTPRRLLTSRERTLK